MADGAATTSEDYGYAADVLYGELRRTWPEELTKQELLGASGLSTEEARAGLALLEEQGRLDPAADQLRAMVDGEIPAPSSEEASEEDEEVGEPVSDVGPPGSTAPVPGAASTYHSLYDLTVSFGQAPGTSREAAVKSAKAIEDEIAERVHKMYPGAIVKVELKEIQVFDEPRTIYPEEEKDDE